MRREKLLVLESILEEKTVQSHCHRHITAGPHLHVNVRLFCQCGASGIHHDQCGAGLLRSLDVGDKMNTGRGRVRAPDDNQTGVLIVRIRDAGHPAIHRLADRSRGCGTDRSREP